MIGGQDLQTLIVELSQRMAQIETRYADAQEPPFAPAEMTMLRSVVREGAVRMSDLAASVKLPQSSATNVADRLCARDLVERKRPETNRRTVLLSATRKARRLMKKIEAEQLALCDELVAGLASEQAELLQNLLGQLTESRATSEPEKRNDD